MTERLDNLKQWLHDGAGLGDFHLEPASEDASFRRYFRITVDGRTFIAMDAPPEKEDMRPFVQVSGTLQNAGVHVPALHRVDLERGFLLLDDLGARLYLDVLTEENVDRLYGDALDALLSMQARGECSSLPPYDQKLLLDEMALFRDWLIGTHLSLELGKAEYRELDESFALLAAAALEQPAVFVHRDYHSRNLMVTERDNPGIIDYQDAVRGPFTYDLVSLLRDCYIRWPRARVEAWALGYLEQALQAEVLRDCPVDESRFLRWFDWMGVQRHLKASGIFARLYRRDGKSGYLADIPRTLNYILEVSERYPELTALNSITSKVVDRLATARETGAA